MTKRRTEILHITQTQRSERQTGTVKGTDICQTCMHTWHGHTRYRQHTNTPWAPLSTDRTQTDTERRPSDIQTDFSLTLTGQGQTQQTDGQNLNSVVLHSVS